MCGHPKYQHYQLDNGKRICMYGVEFPENDDYPSCICVDYVEVGC